MYEKSSEKGYARRSVSTLSSPSTSAIACAASAACSGLLMHGGQECGKVHVLVQPEMAACASHNACNSACSASCPSVDSARMVPLGEAVAGMMFCVVPDCRLPPFNRADS